MDHLRHRVEQAIARSARLLEHTRQIASDTRCILHDARNRRHHAALLRIISTTMRRARSATG